MSVVKCAYSCVQAVDAKQCCGCQIVFMGLVCSWVMGSGGDSWVQRWEGRKMGRGSRAGTNLEEPGLAIT
jgi:hypothetical protein